MTIEQLEEVLLIMAEKGLIPYKDGNVWCILLGENIQEGVCGFGYTIVDAMIDFYWEATAEGIIRSEEQPEADLEKEIEKEWKECDPIDEGMGVETANIHIEAFSIIARHFYELGQRKAAEMYDEIEYNRQRAQEQEGQR